MSSFQKNLQSHISHPAQLLDICDHKKFSPGDILINKGGYYKTIYLITDGTVQVDLGSKFGDNRFIDQGRGAPIGEIGFLSGRPATATVTATGPVTVLQIDDQTLSKIEKENPQLAIELSRFLANKMAERVSYNDKLFDFEFGANSAPSLEIVMCRNDSTLNKAMRIRYKIYCEELGRDSPYADHKKKIIQDDLDAFGHTLLAFEGGKAVGTIRGNIASEGPLGIYEELYGMKGSAKFPDRTSITTKLIVTRAMRGTPTALSLVGALIRFGNGRGIEECYIDCVPGLLHYYRAMGFKHSGEKFMHRENGPSYPLVIDLTKHAEKLTRNFSRLDLILLLLKANIFKMRYRLLAKLNRDARAENKYSQKEQ